MYKWDPGVALSLIESESITMFTGVPTMCQDLMEHPDFSKRNLTSLLRLGGGGSPFPSTHVENIHKKFSGLAEPVQGYGLTETTGGFASISGSIFRFKPNSTGRVSLIVDAKVVNVDTLLEVPPGQSGELLIKSPLVMKGYWNKPEATRSAIISINGDPGWFRTGDIVKFDEDKFLYIVDRAKDIIIRGGENISCQEVEAAFYKNNAVMECSAVPLPHPRFVEVVGLVVVLKPGFFENAEALIASVKGTLANFKIPDPQFIFFSSTPLPRGATDKINKIAIKQYLTTLLKTKL